MRRKNLAWILCCLVLSACNGQTKRMEQAQILFNEGVQLREQHLSEEAAGKFAQGLALVQGCEKTAEVLQLEGQLCDNLGAMYLKHGLFEDAFKQHQQALGCFRQTADSTGMMNAYRNIGRAARTQEQFTLAKQYYDSAFMIAKLLHDQAMLGDLYLEMGRDYYMETGNFAKGIESVNIALGIGLDENDTDIAHMTLGILYYYTRDNEKAKSYLNEALRSERAGLKMTVYQTLCAIAHKEDDYEQAFQYYKLFNESLIESEAEHSSEALQRIKSEFELKAQQSELESLHRNRELKLYLIIALAVIALLIIMLIARKKTLVHRLKMELTQKLMARNKVMATAKALSAQVNSDTLNFMISDNDWTDFINLTDLVFDGFSQRLLLLYPKLGPWDVRICCLSKNGFSNQVISILLDTQTDSYYKRKTRIKQMKMNLGDDNRSFEEIVNAV